MRKTLPLATVGFAVLLHPPFAASQATASQPAFDVASIRPTAERSPSELRTGPGRLLARSLSVKELIEQAYGLAALEISGGPAWLGSAHFDIEAETDGPHSRDEL